MWRPIITRSCQRYANRTLQRRLTSIKPEMVRSRHKNDIFETSKPSIITESNIKELVKLREELVYSIKLFDEKIENPKSIQHLENNLILEKIY